MSSKALRDKVVVGLVQMAMSDSVERNMEHAVSLVRQAAAAGAELICLPELFRSRYFCQCSQPPAPPTRAAMRTTRRSLAFSAAR